MEGRRNGFVRELGSGVRRKELTYFTHPWVFRKFNSGERLFAYSNGSNGSIFEGREFGVADPCGSQIRSHSSIHVVINDQGALKYFSSD